MSTFQPRRTGRVIPVYSLTGDLLNYERCPLQYRLFTRTGVRESHPTQRWYGQFLHRGMRVAYEQWKDESVGPEMYEWESDTGNEPFQSLIDEVMRTLRAEGLYRPGNMGDVAERRLLRTVRLLGTHLFPLIERSEVRLDAVREYSAGAASLYQVTGVVDVLAVARFGEPGKNVFVDLIRDGLEQAGHAVGTVGEIVVDYKGITRERLERDYEAARSQILTYGWLRNREADEDVVRAGVLCTVDDLLPDGADANVTPQGDEARELLGAAISAVPVSKNLIAAGTSFFDSTVAQIENSLASESVGNLPAVWEPRPERRTCVTCDARWHCPASDMGDGVPPTRPLAPSAP